MAPSDSNQDLSNIEKAKIHFRKNKKFYLGFSLGALVVLALHKPVQIINTVAPVFHNDNSSAVLMGGYLHKIVRNNNTGEIWESVMKAAAAAGVSVTNMSRHLNGHTPDVLGQTYSIIGVGN